MREFAVGGSTTTDLYAALVSAVASGAGIATRLATEWVTFNVAPPCCHDAYYCPTSNAVRCPVHMGRYAMCCTAPTCDGNVAYPHPSLAVVTGALDDLIMTLESIHVPAGRVCGECDRNRDIAVDGVNPTCAHHPRHCVTCCADNQPVAWPCQTRAQLDLARGHIGWQVTT